MKDNIPLRTKCTIQKPITNPQLRHLQHRSNQIQLYARTHGWNIALYNTYKTIQRRIREETEKIKDINNTNSIQTLTQIYKGPQKFWQQIKNVKTPQIHINNI